MYCKPDLLKKIKLFLVSIFQSIKSKIPLQKNLKLNNLFCLTELYCVLTVFSFSLAREMFYFILSLSLIYLLENTIVPIFYT